MVYNKLFNKRNTILRYLLCGKAIVFDNRIYSYCSPHFFYVDNYGVKHIVSNFNSVYRYCLKHWLEFDFDI